MRANCWMGRRKLEVREVPDPKILNGRDAIVRITSTAICGSDLHIYDGFIPTMRKGDILGHEFMGEVVETGRAVSNLRPGDRVVVPFPIACGACGSCVRGLYACCENSNPNAAIAERMWGHSCAGLFGYSHMLGGYPGGQAEYARVPFADVGPLKIQSDLPDERVLFLTDIFPTAYMGAELAEAGPGRVVAVWGAGPVGQLAAASARLLGAEQIIVVDRLEYRLEMARRHAGAQTIDYSATDVREALLEMTAGRGPDSCIDTVGMEAHHGIPAMYAYDRAKQAMRLETDRGHALRQIITCCANGGTISLMGAYGGFVDKFPIGSLMNRSITIRTGQCHVQRYLRPLLERIERGEIDPSFIVTHRLRLEDAPEGYETFKQKRDGCVKVVLSAA
jgi:threonine dehydrogenase-like Zn-dependent dehydrogenase